LLRKEFIGGYVELGFLSVRHNAIFKQGVDFDEHYVERVWVAWSHGNFPNICARAYENKLCCSVCILCPQTKM
jgi:hypothetical protein